MIGSGERQSFGMIEGDLLIQTECDGVVFLDFGAGWKVDSYDAHIETSALWGAETVAVDCRNPELVLAWVKRGRLRSRNAAQQPGFVSRYARFVCRAV